jgi:YfiH family protein
MKKIDPPILKAHLLKKIRHGFFTRQGGVSKGLYASLNCSWRSDKPEGSRDADENVLENRKRAAEAVGAGFKNLCLVKQVHGNHVETIHTVPKKVVEGDALVTKSNHLVLSIQTADCTPVLLWDSEYGVIGAAHAGWKGALEGIIQNTVKAMEKLGAKPSSISAAIGPCIHQDSYEMGPEVYDAFIKKSEDNSDFFTEQDVPKKLLFDLPGYVERQLEQSGVKEIERLPYCTYEQEDLFFSCRRATHRHEKGFGGHFSLISLGDKKKLVRGS